jgi:hypothetical protein
MEGAKPRFPLGVTAHYLIERKLRDLAFDREVLVFPRGLTGLMLNHINPGAGRALMKPLEKSGLFFRRTF